MRVLALDQSIAKTGWALADSTATPPVICFGRIITPKREIIGERLVVIRDALNSLLDEHKPDLVTFEDPFVPHQGTKTGSQEVSDALRFVLGLVHVATAERSIPMEHYHTATWRVWLTGYGRAPKGSADGFMKRQVLLSVRARGYKPADDNEGDAIGMALYAVNGDPAHARAQGDLLSLAGGL